MEKYRGPKYYFQEEVEKLMTTDELKQFAEWFDGQTGPLVDGKCAYYVHDVNRFLKLVRENVPTYWD